MNELEELKEHVQMLKDEHATFRELAKTSAISIEQLWELVRDLQGLPVPNGANDVDLRDLV
jgi:hypothetical protein